MITSRQLILILTTLFISTLLLQSAKGYYSLFYCIKCDKIFIPHNHTHQTFIFLKSFLILSNVPYYIRFSSYPANCWGTTWLILPIASTNPCWIASFAVNRSFKSTVSLVFLAFLISDSACLLNSSNTRYTYCFFVGSICFVWFNSELNDGSFLYVIRSIISPRISLRVDTSKPPMILVLSAKIFCPFAANKNPALTALYSIKV